MTTAAYMTGRKRYSRPQAVLWSKNAGTLVNGLYVPTGYEVGADLPEEVDQDLVDQFIVLSDHNRGPIDFAQQRLEQRQRTVNGRMRSNHIADKLVVSLSWTMLPSRAYKEPASFNSSGKADVNYPLTQRKADGTSYFRNQEYTADGGAGGVELLDWYETNKGPFWMYLAYDRYDNFGKTTEGYNHLSQYNQIVRVYFSDFSYSVVNRGGTNHDLWNISVTLEEV